MRECEVCLEPLGVDHYAVTIEPSVGSSFTTAFCRDCMVAVLKVMVERHNVTVERERSEVAWMLDTLGIEEQS